MEEEQLKKRFCIEVTFKGGNLEGKHTWHVMNMSFSDTFSLPTEKEISLIYGKSYKTIRGAERAIDNLIIKDCLGYDDYENMEKLDKKAKEEFLKRKIINNKYRYKVVTLLSALNEWKKCKMAG